MPVLDRALLKELAYNLAFTLAVITSVFLTGAAVKLLHKYPNLDLRLVIQVVPFFFLQHLEFVLPLSLLISVVLVYGRAASNNEINAIKAAGIHPYRVLVPALFIAALVSLASMWASSDVSPVAQNLFKEKLQTKDNIRILLASNIADGRRHFDHASIAVSWQSEEFPEEGGLILHEVVIVQENAAPAHSANADAAALTLYAEQVGVSFDANSDVILFQPRSTRVVGGGGALDGLNFFDEEKNFGFSFQLGESSWGRRLKYRTGAELVSLYRRSKENLHPFRSPTNILSEIHSRIALATCSIFFVLIGAPLALVFRSGSRIVAFLLAFLVVLFVFYPTHLVAKVVTDQQMVHPVLAAWSGNLILATLGVGMLAFVVRR